MAGLELAPRAPGSPPPRRPGLMADRRFWVLVALFAVAVVLQYPQQVLSISSPSLFSFLGLTRHAVERILLLVPVGYASFVFGPRAGLIGLAVAAAVMFPRVFLVSDYFADAMLESAGVVFIGVVANLWFQKYHKESEGRQLALANLRAAYEQLETRAQSCEVQEKRLATLNWELGTSEQRYRQLFENAHDAIWVHDLDGNMTAVNKAAEDLSGGYTVKELLAMNVRSFLAPESLNLAYHIRSKLLAGEKVEQPYEQRLIKRDGTEGFLKLTTNLLREDGKPAGFLHIARDVTAEKKMQDKLSAAYTDLTESHQRLKESQEQLIQAEKLTSLGQLAASIAHEVNNPLSGVLVYNQLLIRKVKDGSIAPETALDYLSKMEAELIRSTKLIRNLLDFARQSPPAFRPVDLNDVVNRAYDLAAHSAKLQHIQVIKELDPALPGLMADFDQLQQVCTNLILNAIQAMPGGGTLSLLTSATPDEVTVTVRDTGSGIAPENMSKLFTPFFTTKREVKGVGLGLAVSYGIVQRHQGSIEVQSQTGKGTTMTIHLPLRPSEPVGRAKGLEHSAGI